MGFGISGRSRRGRTCHGSKKCHHVSAFVHRRVNLASNYKQSGVHCTMKQRNQLQTPPAQSKGCFNQDSCHCTKQTMCSERLVRWKVTIHDDTDSKTVPAWICVEGSPETLGTSGITWPNAFLSECEKTLPSLQKQTCPWNRSDCRTRFLASFPILAQARSQRHSSQTQATFSLAVGYQI